MSTTPTNLDFVTEPLENVADGITLKIPTNLDSNYASEFISTVERLQKQGTKHFVLDMERVLFVNSAAMNFIIRVQDGLNKIGGNMLLIKSHPRVRNMFGSLGLDSYFKLFPNLKRGQDYLLQQLGTTGAATTRPAAASQNTAVKVPPSPAAPTPRPPSSSGTKRLATPVGVPAAASPVAAAVGATGKAAFVCVPPKAKWANLVFDMVAQACAGAGLGVRRMDPADEAGAKTPGELAQVQYVIADLSPDIPNSGQPPSRQVLAVVEAARKAPRQVILLIQGSKELLPAEFRALPTVAYQASLDGAKQLKQFLENGLKTLVARAAAAPKT